MNDRDRDYLEHHGILGMKWGIRRYQNPDGTLTEAGKRRLRSSEYQKPHTSTEKWKYKQIRQIDKLYEKSYRKLDKAFKEEPLDPSIAKYKKELEDQQAKDRKAIEKMSFVDVENARESERLQAKEARNKVMKSAGSALMWSARMALIGTRIAGTVALLNVIGDAGKTAMNYLGSEQGQAFIKSGASIVTKFGNGELTALNLAKDFFSTKAPGSLADKAFSTIDVSSVLPGANYVSPEVMDKSVKSAINSATNLVSDERLRELGLAVRV